MVQEASSRRETRQIEGFLGGKPEEVDAVTGESVYPGNTNQFIVKIATYTKCLEASKGDSRALECALTNYLSLLLQHTGFFALRLATLQQQAAAADLSRQKMSICFPVFTEFFLRIFPPLFVHNRRSPGPARARGVSDNNYKTRFLPLR